ncbi:MAG: winged helix-turn-helix transcriptional regulator [Burkholderiales bacterium]|nr:winged helix-turn-helix transcriptional regulator [Burkholderiales bacterium]MDE2277479.1 winged helix-turn-helix transcriptional regulator [Burkholderiales bacterium]
MSHPTLELKRAYLALRRALEQTVKPFNFTGAQFDVLQFLLHDDGMEHRELQKRLAVSSPTLTNIVDGMVREGHVIRHADPHDGRVKRLYLGDAARKIVASAKFCDAGDALVARMFKGFTAKERQEFSRALSRIEANLDSD